MLSEVEASTAYSANTHAGELAGSFELEKVPACFGVLTAESLYFIGVDTFDYPDSSRLRGPLNGRNSH